MTPVEPMLESDLPHLELVHRGKVRDVYALPPATAGSVSEGTDRLLLVATDRISAFDVVMPNAIPRKGEVLTRLSAYWYGRTGAVVPNAFVAVLGPHNAEEFGVIDPAYFGRSMVVRRADVMRVECVVRGYLAGSGWRDYQRDGAVSGVPLPPGLRQADRLPEPLFTPSSKAEPPAHDEPITYEQVEALYGADLANAVRLRSLALYRYGAEACEARGILIADTKLEFGLIDGEPYLIDEVITPDSSRFWPADQYEPGRDQPSFDKQPLRDWLDSIGWDRQPPAPEMPPEAVEATSRRYLEAYRRITGEDLPDPGA
jgi:phosphoribosylaminoimidazole-succinocarboxamide synthase